jgi:teichuronic acid biosynthesis glycosyltransferase TuaH
MARILFLSHTPFNPIIKVGSHHLAEQFSKLGHNVVHISTQQKFTSNTKNYFVKKIQCVDLNRIIRSLILKAPNLFRKRLAKFYIQFLFTKPQREFDYILIDENSFYYFLEGFSGDKIIYRPTDYNSFSNLENLISRCNCIISTSKAIIERLPQLEQSIKQSIEINGVDLKHFTLKPIKSPPYEKFLYLGAIDHRIDFESLSTFVDCDSNVSIDLIGPILITIPHTVHSKERIRFLGPLEYANVPDTLLNYDAGFFPFNSHPMNSTRSPMKLFEFLSQGLPVIASASEELKSRRISGMTLFENEKALKSAINVLNQNHNDFKSNRDKEIKKVSWKEIALRIYTFIDSI